MCGFLYKYQTESSQQRGRFLADCCPVRRADQSASQPGTSEPTYHIQFDQMTNREWRHQPLVKDADGISSIASCADAFRNLNNSRIIRRIRDFRILDVDVSPHLNSYKTVSTPLRCRFDCASIVRFYMSGSCCRVSDRAYRMPRQLPRYVDSARSNCLFGILDPQNSRIALREDGRLYPIVSRETIVETINIAANFARACLR